MYTTYLAQRAPRDSVDQAVNSFVIANGLNKKEFLNLLLSYRVWFRIKYFNFWCMRKKKQKNNSFLAIAHSDYFLAPQFPFLLSVFLLSLPFAFYILFGCRKKLGVNYGQSLVYYHFFFQYESIKRITLFCNLLRQNAVEIQT